MPRERVFCPMRGPSAPTVKSDTWTPLGFSCSASAIVNVATAAEQLSYATVSGVSAASGPSRKSSNERSRRSCAVLSP